jgi:hypothetical protein
MDQDKRIAELENALWEAWVAMNWMGDILSNNDMVTEVDAIIADPCFAAVRSVAPEFDSRDIYEFTDQRLAASRARTMTAPTSAQDTNPS